MTLSDYVSPSLKWGWEGAEPTGPL